MDDLGAFNDPASGQWVAGNTEGFGYDFQLLAGDVREMPMQQFVPAAGQAQGMPWWESIAAYGITRAIDNRFGPAPVAGNTDPGSFGGQNGRTYTNTPQAYGSAATPKQAQAAGSGGMLLVLAGLAAFAFMG